MENSSALEIDWEYLSLAVESLEDYVLSPERMWVITKMINREPADRARLTIAGIRLCQVRLGAAPLTSQRQTELTRLGFAVERVQLRWSTHWQAKVAAENEERARLWQNYILDLMDEGWSKAIYASQVRLRAMLQLLNLELAGAKQHFLSADFRDVDLRSITKEGPFVWEPEIVSGFPVHSWWFLYRSGRNT